MQQVSRAVASAVGLAAMESVPVLQQALATYAPASTVKPVLIALDGIASWEAHAKLELLNALDCMPPFPHKSSPRRRHDYRRC